MIKILCREYYFFLTPVLIKSNILQWLLCTFGAGCGEWNKCFCSKSQSCLFDCRLMALMYLISLCVHVCVCVFVFTGLLWKLQLGERRSPRASAGNRGTLPEARPAGLERGRTDWPAHRSLWLLLLWVETNTHKHTNSLKHTCCVSPPPLFMFI